MTIQDLKTFYNYNYWATKKVLAVVSELSQEEFTKEVAGGYGSIRNTLVHIMSTEWGWLSRCGGHQRESSLKAEDFPTLESITEVWAEVETYIHDFLGTLTDEKLTQMVYYPGKNNITRSMPMGELLHHSIIHGAHHRGQIAVLLRELGYSPGSIDILFYYAEQHGVDAW